MRLYKFYSARWAREALDRKRLKISTLSDINDPFEFGALSASTKEERAALNRSRCGLMKNKGIVSFSDSWKSPLLWSHYADNHAGIALGFDVAPDLLTKITYPKDKPKLSDFLRENGELDPTVGTLAASVKANEWAYEREHRLILGISDPKDRVSGLHFVEFGDKIKLKEIIFGANYQSLNDQLWTDELVGQGVIFTTARMAFGSFEIVKQKQKSSCKKL